MPAFSAHNGRMSEIETDHKRTVAKRSSAGQGRRIFPNDFKPASGRQSARCATELFIPLHIFLFSVPFPRMLAKVL